LNRFDRITCRLAIQVCTGRTPSGRARHRTFSIKNIRPDADLSAVAEVVRAIAKVLAYPVTKASLVIKKIRTVALDDVQRASGGTTTLRAAGFAPLRGFFTFARTFSALTLLLASSLAGLFERFFPYNSMLYARFSICET
jgi:hypothetical protein